MVKIVDFNSSTRAKKLELNNHPYIDYFSSVPIIEAWPKSLRIQLLSKKRPQDYFPVGVFRLVSDLFKALCLDFDVHAEFLPVQLLEKDGSLSQHQFSVCHLLENVDCFDFERSKCTYRDESARWIDEVIELVIDDTKAEGHHLFRIPSSKFIIASSDQFAEAAQSLHLTGVVFVDPQDWNGVSC